MPLKKNRSYAQIPFFSNFVIKIYSLELESHETRILHFFQKAIILIFVKTIANIIKFSSFLFFSFCNQNLPDAFKL